MQLTITDKNRVWEDNPQLLRRSALCKPHKEGTEDQLDDILRFVFYFADPEDSPLSMERDFLFRRKRAIELGKLKKNAIGKVCGSLCEDKMYEYDEDGYIVKWVYLVLSEYLKLCNSTMFETWLSMKMNFWQTSELLRSPLGADKDGNKEAAAVKRADIQKSMMETTNIIVSLEGTLFSGIKEISDAVTENEMEQALARYAEYNAETLDSDLQRNLERSAK